MELIKLKDAAINASKNAGDYLNTQKDAKKEIGIIHANINLDEVLKARRAIPALNSKKDYLTNF